MKTSPKAVPCPVPSGAYRAVVLANAKVAREPVLNKPVLVMPVLTKLMNVSWVIKINKDVTYLVDSSKEKSEH